MVEQTTFQTHNHLFIFSYPNISNKLVEETSAWQTINNSQDTVPIPRLTTSNWQETFPMCLQQGYTSLHHSKGYLTLAHINGSGTVIMKCKPRLILCSLCRGQVFAFKLGEMCKYQMPDWCHCPRHQGAYSTGMKTCRIEIDRNWELQHKQLHVELFSIARFTFVKPM